jgi:hypothetical protein
MVVLEEMLSPSPIRWVLDGRVQVEGMTMGALAVVAGSRMVEDGGLVIPAHGPGVADVQVILVEGVVKGRPRASMTAP